MSTVGVEILPRLISREQIPIPKAFQGVKASLPSGPDLGIQRSFLLNHGLLIFLSKRKQRCRLGGKKFIANLLQGKFE